VDIDVVGNLPVAVEQIATQRNELGELLELDLGEVHYQRG